MCWRHAWIAAVIAVFVVACRSADEFEGSGEVAAVDAARRQLTLRHEGIAGLMGPTTLQVTVAPDVDLDAMRAGDALNFRLRRHRGEVRLLAANKMAQVRVGLHDHTPHHGGLVAMVGALHLEAVARTDGRVHVYLTDLWRRPLPLADVSGHVVFHDAEGSHRVVLHVDHDRLTAQGPPPLHDVVRTRVALEHAGAPVEMSFDLPLRPQVVGAVGIASAGCEPVPITHAGVPRCTLRLAAPVTAIDTSPAGDLVAVAAVGLGTTLWSLPQMQLRGSLASPPAPSRVADEAPHAESINTLTFSPDGHEIAVAIEGRILVHASVDGSLRRELSWDGGMIRTLAWSPHDAEIVVAGFYDHGVHILSTGDGARRIRLATPDEPAAIAWAPRGDRLAVGTDAGRLRIFGRNGSTLAEWQHTAAAVQRLAWMDDERVLVAHANGSLTIVSPAGLVVLPSDVSGARFPALALAPDATAVVVGGEDGRVRLLAAPFTDTRHTLRSHGAPITTLVWEQTTLLAGDGAGSVSVWDTGHLLPETAK